MKRIDDKIKEIEKKDKKNRWVYYFIVVLLAAFLIYASTTRKQMDLKDAQINELTIKNSATYKKLDSTYTELETTYEALKKSLQPKEYWDQISLDNTVEGYINFITNKLKIDKSNYIPQAINNLKLEDGNKPIGFDGWLFVGSKNNQGSYENKDVIEIIYRQNYDGDEATLKDLEPQIGDIVKLKTKINRKTYKYKSMSGANEQGWRNKTKAFVTDVYKGPNNTTNFNIKIKYY